MQITIDGKEEPALLESLSGFLMFLARGAVAAPPAAGVAGGSTDDGAAGSGDGTAGEGGGEQQTAAAPKKRPGRKANAGKTDTPPPQTGDGPTKTELRDALQGVIDVEALGMPVAMEIVAQFKNAEGKPCETLGSIQEADYAKVIAACKERIKSPGGKASAASSLMGD